MTQSRRLPQWLGVAFLVITSLLLAWNVHVVLRNQRTFAPDDLPKVRSHYILTLAAKDRMDLVKHTVATYQRLRLLAGKTLVVSKRLQHHRFYLERVARLHVEIVPERLALPDPVTDRLIKTRVSISWRLGIGIPIDSSGLPLGLIIEPDATRYVLMERGGGGSYLILPESLYLRERDAAALAPAGATP